ncbi:MAG: M48 family metallopeptidase [candidate division NC10 bacterium]|nr:M48 family metallopeptidase [candidate division NC10 bacterium]
MCALSLLLASAVMAGTPGMREAALKYFTPEEIARGQSYMGGRYLLFGIRSAVQLSFLLLLIVTPAGRILRDLCTAWAGHRPWLALTLYAVSLLLLYRLLLLPLELYGGYYREHMYGLSTQDLGGWFRDWAKGLLLQLVMLVPTVNLLYLFIRRDPVRWFVPTTVILGALILLLTFLAPVVIDPLFHRFTPLEDPALRTRILRLAERAGIPVEQVLVADASRRTVKANAYVTGFGRTKRIVLYDTLLKRSSADEVEAVLAHEMGHRMYHHIWKGVGLSVVALFVGLGITALVLRWGSARGLITDPADPAGLPLLALTLFVLSLVMLPVQNAISRHFERQADRTVLELTGNREAHIKVEVDLARANLADVTPPRWAVLLLYSHPPVLERIAIAE